jgi:hypothetical protein
MSQSPFARAFITSACIAGAVFTASTLPLALAKSKVVNIELQNQTVFSSEMKDLAAPYLSLSGAMSVALGFGIFGVMGWQNSVRKLSKIEGQSSDLARDLAIHQAELERIKFSESRLKAQNLTAYLAPTDSVSSLTAQVTPFPTHSMPSFEAVAKEASSNPHFENQRTLEPQPLPHAQRPFSSTQVSLRNVEGPVESPSDQKGEVLNSLLQQLNQLSQQVEELKSTKTNGLAA